MKTRKLGSKLEVSELGLGCMGMARGSAVPSKAHLLAVAPALEKYTQGRLLGEVWKRAEHGVTPRELSEMITHLGFDSGWANAMAAVVAAHDVFTQREIGTEDVNEILFRPTRQVL